MVGQEWLQEFVNHLRFEKRYSPHTIQSYHTDLRQFFSFLHSDFDISPAEISRHHARSWIARLKERPCSATTINRKISSLQSFYKFLLRRKWMEKNPVALIHTLRTPERLPVFLKEHETHRLLEEIPFEESFSGMTDQLICEVLYQTGLRRQEVVDLKERSIEWHYHHMAVLGKGNKERLIPLPPALLRKLKSYLEMKRNIPNADRDHLFIRKNGRPLYPAYVYRVIRKNIGLVTTLQKKSPHILRHTFATHLLNNGAGIQAIKDLLGHSGLAATQIYTHVQMDQLKEIHNKNHPRG